MSDRPLRTREQIFALTRSLIAVLLVLGGIGLAIAIALAEASGFLGILAFIMFLIATFLVVVD